MPSLQPAKRATNSWERTDWDRPQPGARPTAHRSADGPSCDTSRLVGCVWPGCNDVSLPLQHRPSRSSIMSLFGTIVGGALGGPFGAWVGDQLTNDHTSQGTGPVLAFEIGGLFENVTDAMPIDKGTDGADTLHIRNAQIPDTLAGSFFDVELNGRHKIMSKAELEATTFDLRGGDDTLIVDP